MNRVSCNKIVARWAERRSLWHGRCLYQIDSCSSVLRDLTPREKRYFFLGKLPHWRKAFNDDR